MNHEDKLRKILEEYRHAVNPHDTTTLDYYEKEQGRSCEI